MTSLYMDTMANPYAHSCQQRRFLSCPSDAAGVRRVLLALKRGNEPLLIPGVVDSC